MCRVTIITGLVLVTMFIWEMGLAAASDSAPTVGADNRALPNQEDLPFPVDDYTLSILERINRAGAYQVPQLPLRVDPVYADTPKELDPFGRLTQPFKRYFLVQMEYTGPGRGIPEPEHVDTVKIGFLGPIEPTVSVATGGKSHEENLGQMMLRGCQLAIEEANAAGGYWRRKIPFELVVRNDNGLWGSSGDEIIRLAYIENVWAIIGTIDGANSHIAIRVALKAEVPVVNTGDTDPTFIETNIPWVLRVIADDRRQCYILADYIYKKLGLSRVGIIRASNRYGRFGVREFRDASRRLERPVPIEMAYFVGQQDFSMELQRLADAQVEAVVHWGDAEDGARILNQMREMGMKQPFFACDRCLLDDFVKIAGKNAEGVVCASPWNPARDDSRLEEFRQKFKARFGCEPETYAAHAYDGTQMLIWAIQLAGLNRAKIRDVLATRRDPWHGVTGEIMLTAVLDRASDAYLAIRENNQWKFYSREDLGLPKEVPARPVQVSQN
ncbi:Branched-chain amino acid ABC transporter, amino acid-binding protein [Thermogutta terrifontis]|uniref:Branched-chain amino acid ABC transporter, amino acid-binding protein n=1 Tax=Thermogutta terrifontis TaxID=1331910 RepID=A0A286RGK9_9BACT|nr:Branched-chain amino acid ABC transporter, amino acid-binding protein [Thermogutta terrifontis]